MDALLYPDYSDEEIRREVRNFGVDEDPQDGSLRLEEKGTVYNEYEFVGHGLRSDDSRARMTEAIEVLERAWRETPLVYRGEYFNLRVPELRPSAASRASREQRAFSRASSRRIRISLGIQRSIIRLILLKNLQVMREMKRPPVS